MFRSLPLVLCLACAGLRLTPLAVAQAPSPAAVVSPAPAAAPSPTPDAARAARRALAEKIHKLSDAEWTEFLKAHPEILTDAIVNGVLDYAARVGERGDNDGEALMTRRAGDIADASGSRISKASVLWNQASIEGILRQLDHGIAMLTEAIAMATEAKAPPKMLAGMLSARMVFLVRKGTYAQAMADCDRALQLSTEANYQMGALATLCAMANIYQRQGQPAQAIPWLDQARKWAGDDDRSSYFVDTNYGEAYRMLDQPAKAREYLTRSLAAARRLRDDSLVAASLNENATAAVEARDFATARALLDEALALCVKLGNEPEKVGSQVQLAEVEEQEGHHPEAVAMARTAEAGAASTAQLEYVWQARDIIGRAFVAQGKTDAAVAAFRAAVNVIEEIRAGAAGDEESSQAVLERRVEPYQKLTALLAASGRTEEAFAMAENAKARVLRDVLQRGRMDLSGALTDDERKRKAASDDQLAALSRKLQEARGSSDPAAVETAQHALDTARVDARNLDNLLLSAHPEVRRREAPVHAPNTAAPALAAARDKDAVILEFVTSPDATTLFVAGPGDQPLAAHTLPVGADALRQRVEAFRRSLADRAMNWKEGAGALGRLLLAPADERLAQAGRVVIVPDGPLWDLPFQALRRAEGDCLIDRLAVSYAPSAAFLERVHAERPEKGQGGHLLAMGNPALGAEAAKNPAAALMGDAFAPLPAAEEEVRQLGKMYGESGDGIFLGAAAREDVFKKEAGDFDILHLATHGLLNDANPLYSCLLMAQTDLAPGQDGLLEAREIMDLHLHARLTILAACETARGKAGAGEGQLGLSWALMVAGCPASVVSQWKVDSRSNVDLMLELHRQLRAGKPADEALRQASLLLRKTPGLENPFYWAPFVVVGDGR